MTKNDLRNIIRECIIETHVGYEMDSFIREVRSSKKIEELAVDDAPPENLNSYLKGMSLGSNDKLFFLGHIKPDLIVDFGSADGYILNQISQKFPNIKLIGYDISPDMIKKSKENHNHITFTNNWGEVASEAKKYKKSCILLSSVIHEVYSYSDANGVDKFWNNLFNTGFEFIVVRDTIPSINLEKVKNFKKDVDIVKSKVDDNLLKDYENKWGKIDKNYKNFVRFVLMYRYKENWSRERLEDYLPLTYENLLFKIENSPYKIIYNKQFKYKPIEQSFKKDFGISLRKDTHLKMILRK